MSSRIGDRMSDTRRQRFVGREDERAVFANALAAPTLPFLLPAPRYFDACFKPG